MKLLDDSLEEGTKKTYAGVWKQLHVFCVTLHKPTWSKLPVSPYVIFLFLTHSFQEGKSGATIASMASALSYAHKLLGHQDPCTTLAIKKLILSTQKKAPSADLRCPINGIILGKLVQALPSICQSYDVVMLWALFLTLFYGCFRVGELVARSQSARHLVVQLEDTGFSFRSGQPTKCVIVLRHRKKYKPGQVQQVILGPRSKHCPPVSCFIFHPIERSSSRAVVLLSRRIRSAEVHIFQEFMLGIE